MRNIQQFIKKITLHNYLIHLIIITVILCLPDNTLSKGMEINFRLGTFYDNNILNYSDADLDQMDDPSVSENKYGIESKDDYVIAPEIELLYKKNILGHSTHLGLNGKYYHYLENDIKRYYRVKVFIKRYFRRGTYLQASLKYIPDYYYRNSYSSTAGYQEAKFDKISADLKFSLRLLNQVRCNLFYTYSNKDFIPLFDERDIKVHDFKFESIYRISKLIKLWGSYTFSNAVSAGADNPVYRRDTSYDSDKYSFGSRFYLNGIYGSKLELAGYAGYKTVQFKTNKISTEDRYRLGRNDDRWSLNFSTRHGITSGLDVEFRLNRLIKKTDLPAIDLKKYLEYSSNSYYLIIDYEL